MSERANIEAIAAKADSNRHMLQLSAADVWTAVDDVERAQGQRLLGQDLIAQNYIYRLARKHGAVVVMDGNGLDEVQAGLPLYESEMALERLVGLQIVDLARQLRGIARNERLYCDVALSYLWHFLAGLSPRFREPLTDSAGRAVLYQAVTAFERGTGRAPGSLEAVGAGWRLHCRGGGVLLDARAEPSRA